MNLRHWRARRPKAEVEKRWRGGQTERLAPFVCVFRFFLLTCVLLLSVCTYDVRVWKQNNDSTHACSSTSVAVTTQCKQHRYNILGLPDARIQRSRPPEAVYRPLVPHSRLRGTWEDNIKMGLQEVEWGYMDWIHLAPDKGRWWAFVNAVMNFRVP